MNVEITFEINSFSNQDQGLQYTNKTEKLTVLFSFFCLFFTGQHLKDKRAAATQLNLDEIFHHFLEFDQLSFVVGCCGLMNTTFILKNNYSISKGRHFIKVYIRTI